ncbi:MAG: hypothetical protein ACRBBW_11005 [Cellvibrionaceae bacterium]
MLRLLLAISILSFSSFAFTQDAPVATDAEIAECAGDNRFKIDLCKIEISMHKKLYNRYLDEGLPEIGEIPQSNIDKCAKGDLNKAYHCKIKLINKEMSNNRKIKAQGRIINFVDDEEQSALAQNEPVVTEAEITECAGGNKYKRDLCKIEISMHKKLYKRYLDQGLAEIGEIPQSDIDKCTKGDLNKAYHCKIKLINKEMSNNRKIHAQGRIINFVDNEGQSQAK